MKAQRGPGRRLPCAVNYGSGPKPRPFSFSQINVIFDSRFIDSFPSFPSLETKRGDPMKIRLIICISLTYVALALPIVAHASPMSPTRVKSIHDCNVSAARFRTTPLWGNFELFTYRACMATARQILE